ncbi:MAG: translation initiation factor IF-3 [Candidatus Omnitrophota bacterium]
MIKKVRINEKIRVSKVRLIGPNGEQIGVVDIQEALAKAAEQNLDLVEVSPQTVPPVCRIMDFSKFKYEQEKKEKAARKKQRVIHVKEIRIRPKVGEHDYQVKLQHTRRFLERGDRIKVSMVFRGRELAHQELGRALLERFSRDIGDISEIEKGPTTEGRSVIIVVKAK